IYEDKLGKDHPLVANALNNLATLYQAQGQYAKAEPLFLRALQIYEDKLGKDHPHVVNALNNLAALCLAQGQDATAEPPPHSARADLLAHLALKIHEDKFGKNHPHVANSLNILATLYQAQGQYAKAEPLFQRALQISEDKLGKDHPLVALSLYNLAALYREQ